jgi:hypothetical protein
MREDENRERKWLVANRSGLVCDDSEGALLGGQREVNREAAYHFGKEGLG